MDIKSKIKNNIDVSSNIDKFLIDCGIDYMQIKNMSNIEKLTLSLKLRKAQKTIDKICNRYKRY